MSSMRSSGSEEGIVCTVKDADFEGGVPIARGLYRRVLETSSRGSREC